MKFNNIEWLFFDVGSTLVSEEKPFFIDFMISIYIKGQNTIVTKGSKSCICIITMINAQDHASV